MSGFSAALFTFEALLSQEYIDNQGIDSWHFIRSYENYLHKLYNKYSKMKKTVFLFLLLHGYIFEYPLFAQTSTGINLDCRDSIAAWLAEYKIPGIAIGLIEDAKIKSINAFGEMKAQVPLPVNAYFNVASLTKPVVAITVLKLVDAGLWKLDEPLYPYWIDPDIKTDTFYKKITTRIILSHQTGFPNWRTHKLVFKFEPGTRFGYSGEGFEYLRHALENQSGRSLQALSDSVLFKPAGMRHTRYSWSKQLDSSLFAPGHDTNGVVINTPMVTRTIAADWLITTIEDYTKFGIYVMKGAGLSPTLFQDMARPQVKISGSKTEETMGLGWEVIPNLPGGEYMLMHTGHDDGIATIVMLLPKSKRGLVMFTNGEKGMEVMIRIIKATLKIKELTP